MAFTLANYSIKLALKFSQSLMKQSNRFSKWHDVSIALKFAGTKNALIIHFGIRKHKDLRVFFS